MRSRKPQTEVEVDDAYVTIRRVGADTRFLVGRGEKRIPLHAISSVQWHPPGKRISGFIEFSISGGDERQSKYGSRTLDATKNENAVIFTKEDQPAFEVLRAAVEAAISARHHPQPVTQAVTPPDVADQLTRLADLRDRGVLTDEELERQKARLLAED